MKILKQISVYSFVGFFNAGISFFLMPYLSHFIDPAGYGILSMINSLVTILIPLVGLTASGLIYVEYYQCKDKKEFSRIFSSVQAIPIIPSLLCLCTTVIFSRQLCNLFEVPIEKSYWLPISVIIAVLTIYFESLLLLNVYEEKAITYVKFTLAKVIVEVGLTLLFVSGLRLGWEGRMWSWLIATVFSSLMALGYFKKNHLITTDISWKYLKAGVFYGLPLILHTIGKFVVNQSDRIFIANMVSIEEAGVYNIGYQVGMVLLLVVQAASNFFSPYLMQRLAHLNDKAKDEIVRMSYILLLLFLIVLIVLSLAAPLFFKLLVDKEYYSAVKYVFWIGLSYFFWGVYIIFTGYIFYTKKTKVLGSLAILNIVLNVVLNYYLIQYYGALGAAYATCISFFVIAVLVVWKAVRLFDLPWLSIILRSKSKNQLYSQSGDRL